LQHRHTDHGRSLALMSDEHLAADKAFVRRLHQLRKQGVPLEDAFKRACRELGQVRVLPKTRKKGKP
jgi:hypothetical protein